MRVDPALPSPSYPPYRSQFADITSRTQARALPSDPLNKQKSEKALIKEHKLLQDLSSDEIMALLSWPVMARQGHI
ncbi:unnamed protein product [Brugia pahangi]|uniref:Uncharacterized protein n=1 Tax=Brugia pahangi TaxID=6280 RepID=A0A0N4TIL5_BRUPA|nr:unnamed protein product [Brugia pahangi]